MGQWNSEWMAHPERVRVGAGRPPSVGLPGSTGIVIIGGGVVGMLAAGELRRRGLEVVVLEARNVGSGQSGRNLGFVREQGRAVVEAPAMRYANRRWRELADRLGGGLGWTGAGHLSLAGTEVDLERVEAWGEVARQVGTPFAMRGPAWLRREVPGLPGRLLGAGATDEDGHLDPAPAMRALRAEAEALGALVWEDASVREILRTDGRACGVVLDGGLEVRSDAVLVAAGAWSGRLLRGVGVRLPVHTGRATLAATAPVPRLTERSLWEVGGVGLRQSRGGALVFGLGGFVDVDVRLEDVLAAPKLLPTLWRGRKAMRVRPGSGLVLDVAAVLRGRPLPPLDRGEPAWNAAAVERALAALAELLGSSDRELSVASRWSGEIDLSPDELPIVGETVCPGVFVAAGTSGHGMGVAPAVADAAASLLSGHGMPDYAEPFHAGRFSGC